MCERFLTLPEIQIKFAFRDEIVSIAAMTTGNDSFANGYQIMLCKEYPLPIRRMGLLLLEPKSQEHLFNFMNGQAIHKTVSKISGHQRFAALLCVVNINCQLCSSNLRIACPNTLLENPDIDQGTIGSNA